MCINSHAGAKNSQWKHIISISKRISSRKSQLEYVKQIQPFNEVNAREEKTVEYKSVKEKRITDTLTEHLRCNVFSYAQYEGYKMKGRTKHFAKTK